MVNACCLNKRALKKLQTGGAGLRKHLRIMEHVILTVQLLTIENAHEQSKGKRSNSGAAGLRCFEWDSWAGKRLVGLRH